MIKSISHIKKERQIHYTVTNEIEEKKKVFDTTAQVAKYLKTSVTKVNKLIENNMPFNNAWYIQRIEKEI